MVPLRQHVGVGSEVCVGVLFQKAARRFDVPPLQVVQGVADVADIAHFHVRRQVVDQLSNYGFPVGAGRSVDRNYQGLAEAQSQVGVGQFVESPGDLKKGSITAGKSEGINNQPADGQRLFWGAGDWNAPSGFCHVSQRDCNLGLSYQVFWQARDVH